MAYELAPLQAHIDEANVPQPTPAPINARCLVATCGAFALAGVAAAAVHGATAETFAPDETVRFDSDDEGSLEGKTIVIVSTSAAYIGDHPTGVWLEELATPYYYFKHLGADVKLASPDGGPVPVDAVSLGKGFFTKAAKQFMRDGEAAGALFHTDKLSAVDFDDVDAVYFAGGHGACVDFAHNTDVEAVVKEMYHNDKIVAFDCHGPVALAGLPEIVDGHNVTGFSVAEEKMVKMTEYVTKSKAGKTPEEILTDLGGNFTKADPWKPHAVKDGCLITGQNPQSSRAVAKLVFHALV